VPWPFALGRWRSLHAVPRHERRSGVDVDGPRYLHLPRMAVANVGRFARAGVASILAGAPPDAVVCDYAWPAAAAAPALARAGVPCVVSGRGSDVLQVAGEAGLGPHLAKYLRAAGHWCAVSRDLLAVMDELGGGTGELVPNGVDTELFRVRDRDAARRELGVEVGVPLVVVVGHLIPRKDPLFALRAFAAGAPPTAQLAFVGDGALRAELGQAVDRERLAERVRLVGEVPPERLASWYAAADCLLLTSRREGRPNVVLEALASGRPVLATDVGGTAELLAGIDGALVPREACHDAAEVGRRLRVLLERPFDSADAARLRASVEEFSWERSLDALERTLERARAGGAA
jgi:glycosyltransferase involved in cell wall biosynthesis